MMSAALLNRGCTVLHNCPDIEDVRCMIRIMERMGCVIGREGHTLIIDAGRLHSFAVHTEESKRMRSSVILMGALLGRMHEAVMGEPGGCVIGKRPIDIHLSAFAQMGAEIFSEEEYVHVRAQRLKGTTVFMRKSSVGATENIILAAVLAEGVTRIIHAAREPEITELCRLLRRMGARIEGAGSSCITIRGVKRLHDAGITVMPDRIVTGTYLLAAAGTGGDLTILNPPKGQLYALTEVMKNCGICVEQTGELLRVKGPERYRGIPFLETGPYPGFPTDLQSPLLALLLKAEGRSMIKENIFESRFRVVEQFRKMGGDIRSEGRNCMIKGVPGLTGAVVDSSELRGGAALILAALMAEGTSIIRDGGFIQRGYEQIEAVLNHLGAEVTFCPEMDDR